MSPKSRLSAQLLKGLRVKTIVVSGVLSKNTNFINQNRTDSSKMVSKFYSEFYIDLQILFYNFADENIAIIQS